MKTDQNRENEEYARAEILRLEALLMPEEPEAAASLQRLTQGSYACLAHALWMQARLTEARAAALRGQPGWRETFVTYIDKVQKALNCIDLPLCECLPDEPYHKRFSLQTYGPYNLLECPKCREFFALTQLPEELNKMRSGRIDLLKNTETSKSIADNEG